MEPPIQRQPLHPPTLIAAVLAATGWAWAVALLSAREHRTAFYTVFSTAPRLWGFLVQGNVALLVIGAAAAALGIAGYRSARNSGRALPRCMQWLLAAWAVPLADALRLAGLPIPLTFLEPIWIAAVTASSVSVVTWTDSHRQGSGGTQGGWIRRATDRAVICTRGAAASVLMVWSLTAACAGWWYWQANRAYDDFLLGYNDFGHFAWRVANTWEGRGFLMETPGLPAFWDHFNPGLVLLAPLWGLWPDARLFFVLQAACLALPSPLVYVIARRLGGAPAASAAWAAAYLMYPAVGQLNLNATYGWHPVSLALPLIFASMAGLLSGRRMATVAACFLACSFQEDVVAVLAFLCLMMAVESWRRRERGAAAPDPFVGRLPWWGWLAACVILLATFAAVFELAPFSQFQVGRFSRLGDSAGEILLSPVLRPRVFWGTVLRPRNAYLLLTLLVPLGIIPSCLRQRRRAWPVFAATLVPLAVLIVWGHVPATSIAFQYTTAIIPLFFLGAMLGASAPGQPGRFGALGGAALVACAAASTWFGAMPWSSQTLTDLVQHTYPSDRTRDVLADRVAGTPGNALLNAIVQRVGGRESSVLATGRIASHLLGVRRLDTIAQAGERWNLFQAEIGPGRSPIELFDYIVIDSAEGFYQSPQQCSFIVDEARKAGYRVWVNDRGILLLADSPP